MQFVFQTGLFLLNHSRTTPHSHWHLNRMLWYRMRNNHLKYSHREINNTFRRIRLSAFRSGVRCGQATYSPFEFFRIHSTQYRWNGQVLEVAACMMCLQTLKEKTFYTTKNVSFFLRWSLVFFHTSVHTANIGVACLVLQLILEWKLWKVRYASHLVLIYTVAFEHVCLTYE